MNEFITGGISGAITDPMSKEALLHALKYYEFIRKSSSDVEKIATNTKFTYDQILMIKNYLFINEHNIDGTIRRFDPCFEIAESWQRLAYEPEYIQEHDIILLNHELHEISLINKGLSQQAAHDKTEEKYNYNKACQDFYKGLKRRNNQLKRTNFTGGAITYRTH